MYTSRPASRSHAGARLAGVCLTLIAHSAACASDETGTRSAAEYVVDLETVPPINVTEDWRIGSRDDPVAGFSRIGDVAVDGDGSIYVVEALDLQVRVYDPAGRPIGVIGRRGPGPGEFQRAPSLIGVTGDTVWALSARGTTQRTIALFERDGGFLSSSVVSPVTVPLPPAFRFRDGLVFPHLVRPDGTILGDTMTGYAGALRGSTDAGDATDSVLVPIVRFAVSGAVIDTPGWKTRYTSPSSTPARMLVGSREFNVPRPLSAERLVVQLHDGFAAIDRPVATTADTAVFRIVRTTFNGDTVYRRAFRYTPQPYERDILDRLAWNSTWLPPQRMPLPTVPSPNPIVITAAPRQRPADSMTVWRALRDAMAFPPYQPPVTSAWLSPDGSLWLAREVSPSRNLWLLIDRHGQPRGSLELPRRSTPVWASGDTCLVVWYDDLAVPWLVRFRMR